jgi:hypothetical protein
MTWSPISFGLCPGDKTEDATQFFIKLANKVIDKWSNKQTGRCRERETNAGNIRQTKTEHATQFFIKLEYTALNEQIDRHRERENKTDKNCKCNKALYHAGQYTNTGHVD